MQPGTVPGAVLELHAAKASGGTAPGSNDPLTTEWYDTSGNGNHGTLTNFTGTPWSEDRLTFDGSNDYVQPPALHAIDAKSTTYEVWFLRPAPASDNYETFIDESESVANTPSARLRLQPGGLLNVAVKDDTWHNITGEHNLANGRSHHAVMTLSGETLTLYEDSSTIGTVAVPGSMSTGFTSIGVSKYGTVPTKAFYFPGSIHLARIYPFPLTPEQVAANYAAGLAWLCPISLCQHRLLAEGVMQNV